MAYGGTCIPTSHSSPFSSRPNASAIWTFASRIDFTSLPRSTRPASHVSRRSYSYRARRLEATVRSACSLTARWYRRPSLALGLMEDDLAKTLTLTSEVYAAMVDRALTQTPKEACGLFTGTSGTLLVDDFHPMANVADPDEAWKLYLLDGQEMLDVEAEADATGRTVLGVMHSHTHTTAYPSPTDVADAARFDPFGAWIFVIVSLKHSDPVLRAYRILDGDITEVPVEVLVESHHG